MKYLIAFLMLASSLTSNASHIVGGEIYYDYMGNNVYRFYISVYRDCNSTGAQFDNPLSLSIYNNGALVQNVNVGFPGSVPVPVVFNNPCVSPPNNICTENALYTVDVNLPPAVGGYTVTYQRCCRGPNVTNINNPDNTGFTLTCVVPGINTGAIINSSPRFNDYPPLLLCNNDDLIFDHSATDPDGDQLVYSLVTPYSGASGVNPAPNPSPPPPYFPVNWLGGYTAANPLGPGATIAIDPVTGLLTASPNLLGLFVVGIRVEEYRNGVLINATTRDFLFRVFNCNLQLESILPLQEDLPSFISYCQGLTVDFVNNSYGGTNYEWDFGVPGINTDVSAAFAPSYTYPTDGSYTVMLVVNPGWPCTDTAYMDIIVNNQITVDFTSNDSLCIFGNSFDFVAQSNGPAGSTYTWDFGPNATAPTTTGTTINGVNFSTTGFNAVTVSVENNLCVAEYTDSVYIFPEPIAEIILPADFECGGLTVDFGNVSQNSTEYAWDFGVAGTNTDVSTDFEPTFTFPAPGNYTITLTSGSSPSCTDQTTATITLNEQLVVDFNSEDSLCVTSNNFNFDGIVGGPPGSIFTWNFGPNASIQTSTDIDVANVVFDTIGAIPITLTGTFENCVESITQEIYLFYPPEINFTIAPGLQCAPFNAQFIDQSTAETTIYYNWDFGDGGTSTDQNPTHLYPNVGNYPVTLSIRTLNGCVDTLTLLQGDLVNVRPKPTSSFTVTPDYTDICNSSIQFIDQSIGGADWFYWYDDTTLYSTGAQSPYHTYVTPGNHYPYQIVTNEFGCKDTSSSQLFIEPFTVFAPNTFTPDGDEFNNIFLPIVYLHVEEWHMEIFDRWGEIIWESYDVNVGWDGIGPNGRVVQDGGYVWKVVYVSCEPHNPEKMITGHINVLR
ncbi:MAG: PKD domain-containing protein [Crocinitomicaceae bacterium]|nr:PKD domain-containing protein [Crocinitomicaceae bacterium]MDG1657841.1 PKD domain-containing protein [Crocinitomicaceae bacterium]MDG2440797.1 PKD domain-containing protein [Crocinitomicaceae bacterium]